MVAVESDLASGGIVGIVEDRGVSTAALARALLSRA
jgi:hypothetical protein